MYLGITESREGVQISRSECEVLRDKSYGVSGFNASIVAMLFHRCITPSDAPAGKPQEDDQMKSMRSTGIQVALACGLTLLPAVAPAQTWFADMRGSNETVANASTGFGFATVLLIGNSLTVHLTFSGLTGGPAAAAHIHCCALQGSNAPVVVPFTGFPAATSGTYDNSFVVSDALVTGLNAGLAYTNIHDGTFPGGEIRGQLVLAPEPATLAFTTAGLLALGVAARRRKNSKHA